MKKLTCILLLSIIGCSPIAGCRMVWKDDLLMIGLFTDIKAENASITSDPNKLEILAEKTQSDTDDIVVRYNPYTGVELSTD